MIELPLLFAEADLLWYSVPLIVVISLVYSATRHEQMQAILSHALRLGGMIGGFMVAIGAVLAFISWQL